MPNRRTHLRRPRPGFTLVELMVGIVVTSLVLSAMSFFLFGVGDIWHQTDAGQSIYLAANRATDRIDRLVRGAKLLDPDFTPGTGATPAACMIWAADNNGDGEIQLSEMVLLQYDPITQTLFQYAIPASVTPNPDTTSVTLLSPAAFIATAGVVATPIVHNVTACTFNVVPADLITANAPILEVVMTVSDGRSSTTVYSTAAVRAAREPQ
jgi:prepilin-type N-terminal cleavage/methylation domain-containing protein